MCKKVTLEMVATSIKNEALRIFADKLNSVILYGSYARGDNTSRSDIDLMLLVDIPVEILSGYRGEIAKISSRLSLESEECITISVALQDIETFEKYKTVLPFFRSVVSEGIVVYAA